MVVRNQDSTTKEIIRRGCGAIGISCIFLNSYITYQEILKPGLDSSKKRQNHSSYRLFDIFCHRFKRIHFFMDLVL
jgi:hypothetical protein